MPSAIAIMMKNGASRRRHRSGWAGLSFYFFFSSFLGSSFFGSSFLGSSFLASSFFASSFLAFSASAIF
jgi:hypothetical protein